MAEDDLTHRLARPAGVEAGVVPLVVVQKGNPCRVPAVVGPVVCRRALQFRGRFDDVVRTHQSPVLHEIAGRVGTLAVMPGEQGGEAVRHAPAECGPELVQLRDACRRRQVFEKARTMSLQPALQPREKLRDLVHRTQCSARWCPAQVTVFYKGVSGYSADAPAGMEPANAHATS